MSLDPFVIDRFGGLNLADDPVEVGAAGAVKANDVDLDRAGRIRCRNGFLLAQSVTATFLDGFATFETTAGLKQYVLGYQNGGTRKYEAFSSTGGAAIATVNPALTRMSSVRVGTPTNEYLYIGNGSDTIWRWDGAAFTQPAGMPASQFLAVDANSNRLVGAVSALGGSAVEWSDPGLPETWSGNNIQLTPGDGSFIQGLASWQDYVFAFKRRRFFVFTGESVGNTGKPVFNYDTVDGYGCIVPPVAGDEGVYFFDGRSIWVTTGGVPTRISRPIEPMIRGEVQVTGAPSVSSVDPTALVSAVLSYSLGRLYVSLPLTPSGRAVLVFDPKVNAWTLYLLNITFFAPLRRAGADSEYTYSFGKVAGQNGAWYQDPATYKDAAVAAINWSYNTGQYALGPPNQVAVTGYTQILGGVLDATAASVFASFVTESSSNSGSVAFTAAVLGLIDVQEGWMLADCEGRRWQLQLAGTNGQYVSRVTQEVVFIKAAGRN